MAIFYKPFVSLGLNYIFYERNLKSLNMRNVEVARRAGEAPSRKNDAGKS